MRPTGYKCWIVTFRERRIKRTMTLGSVAEVSANQARSAARKQLATNRFDGLPQAAAPRRREGPPRFRDYVEAFWADYARHWKPATQKRNRSLIGKELVPAFGNVALDTFTAPTWFSGETASRSAPVRSIVRSRC